MFQSGDTKKMTNEELHGPVGVIMCETHSACSVLGKVLYNKLVFQKDCSAK